MRRAPRTFVALLATTALLLSACGDDSDDEDSTATTEASASADIEVTAVDYAFEGLPDSATVGAKVTLENSSEKELHEFVAMKLPDTERRPASELVTLPQAELQALAPGEPAMVILRPPGGGEQVVAVGDGTFPETGRYLIVCAIPLGADPAAYMAAAAQSTGGPPDVPGGPPHFTAGMFGEIAVA